ncbi:hypothetical protein [Cysteiniphilum sp. QT6929]|uniref:hypothetical protein n=1 Tax=Cysteiniphilum sp. QT6929 TaxID=2975055 RepID=UPI0024B35FE1|nr:hypothetical protein [Cysteiniphilum sp. QT6929]WHN65611.1 hypothetical protein NYP54_11345 [Cysteiniphilum sp. QT6929]
MRSFQNKWSRNWLECKLVKDDYYLMNWAEESEINRSYNRRLLIWIIIAVSMTLLAVFSVYTIIYLLIGRVDLVDKYPYWWTPIVLLVLLVISLRLFLIIFVLMINVVLSYAFFIYILQYSYDAAYVMLILLSELIVVIFFLLIQRRGEYIDSVCFDRIYSNLTRVKGDEKIVRNKLIDIFLQGAFGFTAIWCLKSDEKTPYLFAFKTKYFRYMCVYPWLIYSKPEWFGEEVGTLWCFALCRWIIILPSIMFTGACVLYIYSKF